MKKILVPTDFSPNAENATQFAIQMANLFQSEICLLHSYLVASKRADILIDLGAIMRSEAEENLRNSLIKTRSKLQGNATARGEVIEGSAIADTADYALKEGCSLIVMGTQGATGALEVFIGSTTGGVLQHSSVPVLAIPAGYVYKPFKKIVLALDNLPLPDGKVFEPLQKIAAGFGAKVAIFHHKTDDEEKGADRAVEPYLHGIEVDYFESSGPAGVYESINKFTKDSGAGLLCMVRRKKGFFESLFKGSSTLKQVYNSPVPLLALIAD